MLEELSAGQYLDWEQFHRQFNLETNKEDLFWAMHIADYKNAHLPEHEPPFRAIDLLPWIDPYADDPEDFSAEDLLRECGFGKSFVH